MQSVDLADVMLMQTGQSDVISPTQRRAISDGGAITDRTTSSASMAPLLLMALLLGLLTARRGLSRSRPGRPASRRG